MIIDSLKNSARYEQLNPYFKQAFEFIKSKNLLEFEEGKTELAGDDLKVMVNVSKLKETANAKLEIHNKFIDIQLPISCPETFGWKDRAICKDVTSPYNQEKDIEFYGDESTTYITAQPGEFVIFFPEDAHAPCIGEGEVKKMIVKVKN